MIKDRELLNSLNRRIKQQQKNVSNFENNFRRREHELLQFTCENNSKLTWTEVFEKLTDMENSNINTFSIPTAELISIATIISANIVTHRNELLLELKSVDVITKLFPVIYVCNKDVDCFINVHEFFYSPGVFEIILFPPTDESPLTAEDSTSSNSSKNGDTKENEEKGKGVNHHWYQNFRK